MVFNETQYQLKTCAQLRNECKELKITGYSNKNKEELISLLKTNFQNQPVEQPKTTDSDDMFKYNMLLMKNTNTNSNKDSFIGEDRNFGGNELFIDLIPQSCWFKNARSNIDRSNWDYVRNCVYSRVYYICECCGIDTNENNVRLDCHERWNYDQVNNIQSLVRLIALCQYCHESTHMGLAQVQNRGEEAMQHLMNVRNCTIEEAESHKRDAFAIWRKRNQVKWILDLSMLEKNGIQITKN